MRAAGQIERLVSDLRFATRMFLRTPGVTSAALISLALGIGANTAVFSVVDAVMLKLLPVKSPAELYFLTDVPKETSGPVSLKRVPTPFFGYDEYNLIRDAAISFTGLAAFRSTGRISIGHNGRANIAEGQVVSGNYFSLLGVTPILGRTFDETEMPDPNSIAVISYQYWQQEFGGEQSVIGQEISINNTPSTIVGVMPSAFFGLEPGVMPQIWVPTSMKDRLLSGRDVRTEIVGRLRQGSEVQHAQAEMDIIFAQILAQRAPPARLEAMTAEERAEILGRRIELTPGGKGLRGLRDQIGDPVLLMMIIVALVLLIACANVATLMLARATRRRKEFAVRIALGASRGRVLRQLLTESVFLAVMGGLMGILLASWGLNSLLSLLASGPTPIRLSVSPDLRVIAYAAGILGLTVLMCGLVPALRATGIDVAPTLKENSSGVIGSKNRIGVGKILVVIQVALSLLLLVAAGLFVRTLRNIENLGLGFKPEAVLIATADPGLAGYKGTRAIDLCREIRERIEGLKGIRSTSLSAFSPIGQLRGIAMVTVPAYIPAPGDDSIVSLNRVGPGYFETLGIPLLRGRGIEQSDSEDAPKIAVINETMANKYFEGQDAMGKTFNLRLIGGVRPVQIAGIVKDFKYSKVQEEISPTVYTPVFQSSEAGRMTFEVRAESDPRSLIPDIRRVVSEIDSNVPLFDVKTIKDQIDESLIQQRLTASLSSFFGLLALLLACVGLFGVTSHEVARSTNEIGIRMALGATPGQVLWAVMRRSLILVLIGMAIGLLGAFFLTPLVSKLLFGLKAGNTSTFAAAAAIMAAAAIVASYIPARRASHIDPIIAIRHE